MILFVIGLLHKLRFIGVGGQFLSLGSQFHSDRRQRVRLDGKISLSVDLVLGALLQGSVLEPLLFYCTIPSSSTWLETICWVMRLTLQSMQSLLGRFLVIKLCNR